jgi:hypothetical protein
MRPNFSLTTYSIHIPLSKSISGPKTFKEMGARQETGARWNENFEEKRVTLLLRSSVEQEFAVWSIECGSPSPEGQITPY